jgi:hypothetical protein
MKRKVSRWTTTQGLGGETMTKLGARPTPALLLLASLALPALAQSEKFIATEADIRAVLHFKVSDAAILKLLPNGWELDAPTAGPYSGANYQLYFIDRVLRRDPDGKPLPSMRFAVSVVPAKKTGAEARGLMVVGGFASHASGAPGAYGNYVKADAEVDRKLHTDAEEVSTAEESWDFRTDDGDRLQLQIRYVRGMPTHGKAEARAYSAVKPDFYRIYRLEQAVDVLRGTGAADRVQKISFKASGAKLAPVFDGSEQLISVASVPWYIRSTHLPGS